MANRNIAFTVQLNGTEQVFNSIKEFEQALRDANIELKNFTGSEADFKKLQDEIKKAESELNKIKEGAKGLTVNKQIGEFLKFGQVIAGAFGAATTALSLFGMENEDVTKAAAKAQQILTLQYSIVTLAKEKDTIATAFNTASTIANTLATQGLRAAMSLLFATMKANPMGAFLTILSLVVGAVIAFTDETEDATKAEEQFQKVLRDGQIARQRNLQLLQAQGKSEVELAEASAKAAEDRFNMARFYYLNTSKDAEMFAKVQEEYDEAKFQRDLAQINLTNAKRNAENEAADDAEENRQKELRALEERRRIILELLKIDNERLRVQSRIEGSNVKIIETENEILSQLEKKLRLLEKYSNQVVETKTFEEELAEITQSAYGEFDVFGAVFNRVRQRAEELFKQVGLGNKTYEEAQKELRSYREESLRAFNINIPDSFYKEIRAKAAEYRKEVAAGNMTMEEQRDKLKEFRTESLKKFGVPFDEDKLEQLSEFTIKYSQAFKVLADTPVAVVKGLDPFYAQFEQAIVDYALLIEKLENDPFLARTPERRAEARLGAEKELEEARERFAQAFVSRELTQEKLGQLAILTTQQRQEELKKLNEEGRLAFDELVKISLELIGLESDVQQGSAAIDDLNQKLLEAFGPARTNLILKNREQIAKLYQIDFDDIIVSRDKLLRLEEQIATKRFDVEKNFSYDVEMLNEQLADKIPGFAELSYREKLFLLREYLKREVEATENAEKEKQDAQQKTIDKILDQIQLFQQALQAIQQTVSDYYNFQFDQLEKRNKRIQDSIVGDSERANQLRLEADKAYTAERERLEKRQAKISLRLTLAQTIANVAQAVAQSLNNPILAGIVAAAGVGQIAIIQQQIATIDAYKRGGRLKKKAQGGLVVGPSHEEGGVKFQEGGFELEGNEAVINRLSTLRYADILSSINISGGGKPIVMSNFDDSRIVEAIAKQRQTPIRAYVVESDITSAQTINKRLELLSQI